MRKSISMMQKKRRMNNQFSEKEEWKTWRREKKSLRPAQELLIQ